MKLDIDFHKIDLPVELMQICGVSAACVYAVLRAESDENGNGICELSRNEIARRTGLKNRIIPDLIVKLEALGIVERHYNPGYATSYLVKDILSTEQPEVRAALQLEQQPKLLKPECKFYGEYGWIALTDKEYESLVQTYSKSRVDDTIETIDNNIEARKIYNPGIKHGDFGKAYVKEWIEKDIRKAAPNNVIKQQEMREIRKYAEERNEEIDKYLELIN